MEIPESAFDAETGLRERSVTRTGQSAEIGQEAVQYSKAGVPPSEDIDDTDEETPLIARSEQNGGSAEDNANTAGEFDHLPWYRRPSVYWVLPPFFLVTLAFGGVLPPKLNLVTELICRAYMEEQMRLDPSFVMTPVDFDGGENKQCRIPEVSSRVALFTLALTLISGIASALVSPHLGALSDRHGRKPVLVLASVGAICNEVISITAALRPDSFPVNFFLLGAALDGLTGSFTVAIAIANAYATDVIAPAQRNVVFARFHAALFTGLAIGPIVAGAVVKLTGQISSIFVMMLVMHVFFGVFVAFIVPESLSKKRQMITRERHEQEQAESKAAGRTIWHSLVSFYAPLNIFWPTGQGSSLALRLNLVFLASVDTIAFGVAMGTITVVLVYTNLMFGWETFETSVFMTVVNGARVFVLLAVLPLLVRFFKPKPKGAKVRQSGSDFFDLSIIRLAMFFDTLGYVGYILAGTGGAMLAAGAVAATGGIGSPTLQAALTRHVPSDRTGQLLGAIGLLHALARVVAPTVFSAIFAATTKTFPGTVFICLAATFSVAFVISWLIRPHVHWDDHLIRSSDMDADVSQSVL